MRISDSIDLANQHTTRSILLQQSFQMFNVILFICIKPALDPKVV